MKKHENHPGKVQKRTNPLGEALKTEGPLSEEDEVKAAERHLAKLSKKPKGAGDK